MRIQSYVDLITNSSSSVYQMYNGGLEDVISTILKVIGLDYECNDFFEIKEIPSDFLKEILIDNLDCSIESDVWEEIYNNELTVGEIDTILYRRSNMEEGEFIKLYEDHVNNSERYYDTYVKIVPINGYELTKEQEKNLRKINNLFCYEASCD